MRYNASALQKSLAFFKLYLIINCAMPSDAIPYYAMLCYAVRYDTCSHTARNTDMKDDALIVFTVGKGGVGKSTLAVLITEWLLAQGTPVQLIDADPYQTSKTWVDQCAALGYRVSIPVAPVTIVDTA